jgi:putative ATPase
MSDLFNHSHSPDEFAPLAAKMRPHSLDNYVGQVHLLGKDKPLRKAIEQGKLHSMILWGPPGTGKTTLARIIANVANANIEILSAVLSGVKDIRLIVDKAKQAQIDGVPTVVFVDEVHRFNKAQQDAFLPHVESGLFIFIGATTENPSFEVNNALLSRARVYVLKSLTEDDILQIIDHALATDTNFLPNISDFSLSSRQKLASFADGDARTALNFLDILNDVAIDGVVTDDLLNNVLTAGVRRFDKQGEDFYNQISALHKSVRGSNPDGALYWLACMIDSGCDPLYIARRVVRMASEDIGNADPRALTLALEAWEVQQRLGSPEGELAIAQAVTYLAVAPKSNAVYVAWNNALQAAKQSGSLDVPLHLRNAPTKLMRELDYGKHYRYAHDEPNAYAAGESYLPDEISDKRFYYPVDRGLEQKIKAKLEHLRQLDLAHKK